VKKQLLVLLIVIMSIAMTLFIGIQVYWIQNSMQLREANFKRSIDEAVNRALLNLETIEFSRRTAKGSLQLLYGDTISSLFKGQTPVKAQNSDTQNIGMTRPDNTETGIITMPDKSQPVINNADRNTGEQKPSSISDKLSDGSALRKQIMLNYVMNQTLDKEIFANIETKISVGLIDTLLRQELLNKGITIDYEFGVYSPDRNKIVLEKTGNFHDELLFKGFSFPLFSGSTISTRDFLLIYFPEQSRYNLKSLWIMMLVSHYFVLVVFATYSY